MSPNHRGSRENLIALTRETREEIDVLCVALHAAIPRDCSQRTGEQVVLAVIVEADNLMALSENVGNEMSCDEAASAGHEDVSEPDWAESAPYVDQGLRLDAQVAIRTVWYAEDDDLGRSEHVVER